MTSSDFARSRRAARKITTIILNGWAVSNRRFRLSCRTTSHINPTLFGSSRPHVKEEGGASTNLDFGPWRVRRSLGETYGSFASPPGSAGGASRLSSADPDGCLMEALFVSAGVVAVAEIGDKTQLLSMLLATRFKSPLSIILGIFCATVANHAVAAWVGAAAAAWLGSGATRWILGLSFIAMAGWTLVPDKVDGGGASCSRFGAFLATLVAFFLVEIGDKTQVATVVLSARFNDLTSVVLGTTVGMMIANVPAVLLGEVAATRIPLKLVRGVAAAIFLVLGLLMLTDLGALLGGL